MNTTEERVLKNLFGGDGHFFDHKGIIHIGTTTGVPGNWKAHPYCGKRINGWIGFGEIKHSKFDKLCPMCLFIHMAKQIDQTTIDEKDGIIDFQSRRITKLEGMLESMSKLKQSDTTSLLTGEECKGK